MTTLNKRIIDIICNLFNVENNDLNIKMGPGDIPLWDSVGHLRLIMELEKEFNLSINVDELINLNNIEDIINLIAKDEGGVNSQLDNVSKVISNTLIFPSNISYGNNAINKLTNKNVNESAIIVSESKYGTKIIDKINQKFKNSNIKFYRKLSGEPNENVINNLTEFLNKANPINIIAIGGGSTIDATKIARFIHENQKVELKNIKSQLYDDDFNYNTNLIAIPTIFGSGSEASSAAAFTKDGDTMKTIMVNHNFIPNLIILDYDLMEGVEKNVVYSCIFDALSHAIEGYVSIIKQPMLKNINLNIIKDLINLLEQYTKGNIDKFIEKLSITAYYAGIIQNNCSVGLCHSIAHQLNNYGVSHGIANANLLGKVIKLNYNSTDAYDSILTKLNLKNINELVELIDGYKEKAGISFKEDTLMKIKNDSKYISECAMRDITYKTNPNRCELDEIRQLIESI